MLRIVVTILLMTLLLLSGGCSDVGVSGPTKSGFARLFNGRDLAGWKGAGRTSRRSKMARYTASFSRLVNRPVSFSLETRSFMSPLSNARYRRASGDQDDPTSKLTLIPP